MSANQRKKAENVGILALEVYFPRHFLDQTDLEANDGCPGKYTEGLGQRRMSVFSDLEDVNSICLTALHNLVERVELDLNRVGYLAVGTETQVDKSKATKTVLMQLFEASGNVDVAGVDCKNACFGGTAALFGAADWLESSAWDGRLALVVAGDIAIYGERNTRPTGGGGAVAILLGPDASLRLEHRAHYMAHRWDFYKPDMTSEYPTVDGALSIRCFQQALEHCWFSHQNKSHETEHPDFFCFHSPFIKLVQKSFARIFFHQTRADRRPIGLAGRDEQLRGEAAEQLRLLQSFHEGEAASAISLQAGASNPQKVKEFEKVSMTASRPEFERCVEPSLLLSRNIGNMYCASVYASLASLFISLADKNMAVTNKERRNIGLFSYGSGVCAAFFSIRIAGSVREASRSVIGDANKLRARLENDRIRINVTQFEEMFREREAANHAIRDIQPISPEKRSTDESNAPASFLFPGTYYLERIDDKSRRFYKRFTKE